MRALQTSLIALSMITLAWVPTAAIAASDPPTILQEDELAASDAASWSAFGAAVDIDDHWAVIGAPFDNDQGVDAGALYVYERDGPAWIEHDKLVAFDGTEQSSFGAAVALDGDWLAVGAPRDDGWCHVPFEPHPECDAGAVYVFRFAGSDWVLDQKIVPEDAAEDDHFGSAIALDGDRLLVGAPGKDTDGPTAGAAYIYEFASTEWTGEQIVPDNRSEWDRFGSAVALDGDLAIVTSPRYDVPCTVDLPCPPADSGTCPDLLHCDAGAVLLFEPGDHAWVETGILVDPIAERCDLLGASLALHGDLLVAGAPHDAAGCPEGDGGSDEAGHVRVFEHDGTAWAATDRLQGDVDRDDGFGRGLAAGSERIIVGSPRDQGQGTAAIFTHDGTAWTQERFLEPESDAPIEAYGTAIAIAGPTFLVGAPQAEDGAGTWTGSSFVFGIDGEEDGLTAGQENELGSDDTKLDSDGDGLTDPEEAFDHGTDPASTDTDADGLDDPTEVDGPTDPLDPDTDGDDLLDGEEVNTYGTDPTVVDTDEDDLEDGLEVHTYGTDPTDPDTDGDMIDDGTEAEGLETDPNDPNDPLPLGGL